MKRARHVTLLPVVDNPIEWNRGNTPPMVDLDLQTLESEPLHRAETAMWPTTPKGYMLWALAALGAIVLGVIPALWINHWRHGDAIAAPAPAAAAEVATPSPQPTDEDIEITPTDELPATAAAERATVHPTTKATKRKPERTRPSTSRVRKQPHQQQQSQPQEPTCNVYLHPKGCPR